MIDRISSPTADGTIRKVGSPDSVAKYSLTQPNLIDLSLAGNPLGSSATIRERYNTVAQEIGHRGGAYPHIYDRLVAKLKDHHGIPLVSENETDSEDQMILDVYLGIGCTGIIQDIFNSGLVSSEEYLVVPDTTFPVPAGFAAQNNVGVNRVSLTNELKIDFIQMRRAVETMTTQGFVVSMIFLANPNNPTGYAESTRAIIKLAEECHESLVVVSEANIDYVPEAALTKMGGSLLDPQNIGKLPKNLVVLRSFSKGYGMADERIGYAVANRDFINALRDKSAPFNMPAHSIISAMIALDDPAHVAMSRNHMERETKKIAARLITLGFPNVTDSDSNLLVARVPSYFSNSDELASLLNELGCSVVSCGAEFGRQLAGTYIRIAPSTSEQNDSFLKILEEVCKERERVFLIDQQARRAPTTRLADILRVNSATRPSPPLNNGRDGIAMAATR